VAWEASKPEALLPTDYGLTMLQAPVLSDLDDDGDIEWMTLALLNGRPQLYVWGDARRIRQPMVGWPQAGRDARRTSAHPAVGVEELRISRVSVQPVVPLVRIDELQEVP
jgi:hypothetical protein